MLINFKGIKYPGKRLSNLREQELILNLQDGELESFSFLYARFAKPILKFVLRHVRSRDIAEELTQDVFLKVYQHRGSYDPQFEVSTWIWTIARNTVYDYLRQSRSSNSEFSIGASEPPHPLHESVSHRTAETIIMEEFEKIKLTELMATLSTKQKEAIFLRLVKKFSYQEISKSMNLSLSAVKSLINRGKSTLIKLHLGMADSCTVSSQELVGSDVN